ncbi:MAG: bifunctional (p)ppGpp synthetase/guanosine-3',5'-bis(diphosphate) 3'-pyrophosphohydrolase [Thermoleophilia bacterium]|jgi:GTP pyrophosphokinase|nr:bifunctional (p)ppGpp synthetase/guanosine-3',5'-bis(diphosphate) 3'-pyrophosphohydrolase [Thermoleophilia bacterium]
MATPLADLGLSAATGEPQLEELIEEVRSHHPEADADAVRRAYAFAERQHRDQVRRSGEPFISHPLGCARICASLGLDGSTIQAALLHDTVEDTGATLADIERDFGGEVAALVDGVTKLTRIHFESQEERQAENYRKLIVSMSSDIRVLLVKLADRMHNMRTLSYMSKAKQIQKAKETLEIYAPLAHRLGIHSLKWELEDLAFSALHPKRYAEIQQMVNMRRADREQFVAEAGAYLESELRAVGIEPVEITGRAKHFYSIYEKMTRRGKEFNEIYDLTAMRVIVRSVKDCYGAVGIIHSLWKPMPGRFKDYIAMPKLNMYQSLHTTVIGPHGKPLEIQIRTPDMHRTAEFGVAAHWLYKADARGESGERTDRLAWLSRMMDWQRDTTDPGEFLDTLRSDLYSEEVYVFTPKGEVRALPAGSTPLDFAYDVHTDVGHRCVGAKVNGRIVPLTYRLASGDFVEILTSKAPRAPSRDWLAVVTTSKARSKIRAFFRRERRHDAEHQGREVLQESLRKASLPSQKIAGSPLLAQVIQEMGFKRAEDFYVSLGLGKTSVQAVVNKIIARLKVGQEVAREPAAGVVPARRERPRSVAASSDLGIDIDGVGDVLVRLAKCCKPVPGDPILGYISLGRGITIHREDCPNAQALMRTPERFTPVQWAGTSRQSFRVELAVDAWDRTRLLEDISRTIAENGINILGAQCQVDDQMARHRFVLEMADVEALRHLLNQIRNIESVFDAYRVTPGR